MPPHPCNRAGQWRVFSAEIMAAIQEWRPQHPKATLQEIEGAIDARLAEFRTRMLEDIALASSAADVSRAGPSARPNGPYSGGPVAPRGPRERPVLTHQGKTRQLRRSYVSCPTCQVGFFPPG